MSVIDLDDERADQLSLVGAKAARLAQARRRGLPVLPGVVVPAQEAVPAMACGMSALASGGPGKARLAITRSMLDPLVTAELGTSTRRLGADRFIVRSSSLQESSAVWGGAFASYPEVPPDEIAPSVRACWASAFSRHVLELCEAVGVTVGQVQVAVLIQPHVRAEAGGTATVHNDGSVTVIGAAGSPAGLLGGLARAGCVRVRADGEQEGAEGGLDPDVIRMAAELAEWACEVSGYGQLEWAVSAGRPVILQLQPVAPNPRPVSVHGDPPLASPTALRIARLVHRFRGPTGESLVLPWALGATDLDWDAEDGVGQSDDRKRADPRQALAGARCLSADLTAATWRLPSPRAEQMAGHALQQLRGAHPGSALAAIERLGEVDCGEVRELRALLRDIAQELHSAGAIVNEWEFWRLDPRLLEGLMGGGRDIAPGGRVRVDAWDSFLYAVVSATGSARWGTAASPGIATGPLCPLRSISEARQFPAGGIILTTYPTPLLAPLLWRASGLVTWAGSPAAHLVEVARALGVPAVVSCPLEDDPGRLAGIDGNEGIVWIDTARSEGTRRFRTANTRERHT